MSTDNILHIVEIVIIGAPIWYGAVRLSSIMKDFPPHRHDNGHILYPKGYEPPAVQNLFKAQPK